VLARLIPGGDTLVHTLGLRELPRWSRDGRTLYFVRHVPGAIYQLRDESANPVELRSYTSAIWRAKAHGTGAQRLLVEDAYAFAPLQLTPDGRALVFSRIANIEALRLQRLLGNRVNNALLERYRPTVSVQRLDLTTGRVQTLVAHGGRPAVASSRSPPHRQTARAGTSTAPYRAQTSRLPRR
jgi:Tol biopolymer transport system component